MFLVVEINFGETLEINRKNHDVFRFFARKTKACLVGCLCRFGALHRMTDLAIVIPRPFRVAFQTLPVKCAFQSGHLYMFGIDLGIVAVLAGRK